MFYRRRASPKHRYNIIEVDYGGGGHRTRLRDQKINCCVYGVPPAPFIKEQGRERRPARRRRARRSPTPTGSRTPSLPCWNRRRGEEEAGPRRGRAKCGVLLGLPSPCRIPPPIWNRKRGREKGEGRNGAPPFPSPIRTRPRGGVRSPLRPFSFFPVWPNKAQYVFP